MKYYSETDVKEMIDYATAYGTGITNYRPSLDDYPSIEIKEPHGRLIDVDEFIAKIKRPLTYHSWVFASQVQPIIDSIESAPTVLEASNGSVN